MMDLSNNPFSNNNGNPLTGKELDWLKWNSKTRREANPFVDSEGGILNEQYDEFSEYMNKSMDEYQKDLLKLPLPIQQTLENNSRQFSERMQVEATGHR